MRIALLGYGTVGKGVAEILDRQDEHQLVKILRRDASQLCESRMCLNMDEIINDDTVDIIIEAMSGVEPAYSYTKRSLIAGKHVVSANKAMIALHQIELHELAKKHQVQLRYEASCGGGIPWLMSLMKAQRIDDIHQFRGIFNGTCNFILDEMTSQNKSFQEALSLAQQAGFAEADPSADISGADTLRKAIITARLAFYLHGQLVTKARGIENITAFDIQLGKQMGCVAKLIAAGIVNAQGYEIVVEPVFVPIQFMEASIHAQYNIVTLHGETIGDLTFSGQGAGSLPTANALFQDVLDIVDQQRFEPSFHCQKQVDTTLFVHTYLLRTSLLEEEMHTYFKDYQIDCGNGLDQRYFLIHKIPAAFMHDTFENIFARDSKCFMARVMTKEDL